MSRHLITAALPYANGSIHIGHLVEYLQADIYVRFLRTLGEDAIYLCADDTHGTPIELNARKRGIAPEELIAEYHEEHQRDFAAFGIEFDEFYTTHSDENRELASMVYGKLRDGGHVVRRTVEQMYSESLGRFLPDRLVKGTCPHCKTPDQYGDICEACGRTYEPTDLIDPVDAIEGETPVIRETEQLYVRLTDFEDALRDWVAEEGRLQPPVRKFVENWLEGGLEDWCISRDAPYFGFEIPGETGKFFYVWLDAPIGYIATTKRFCDRTGRNWRDYWDADSDARITHIIGKDIVYFHTLFWPAMLRAAGLKQPDRVHVHGMLTVNGEKMSKSRGTSVRASTYLEHLDPSYLRYYYATKLSTSIDDLDLNVEDFVLRVNADLVNNVCNLCNRVTKFLAARFDGEVGNLPDESRVIDVAGPLREAREAYVAFDFARAARTIAALGREANQFFQDAAPWAVIKEDPEAARRICAEALRAVVGMMAALRPIVPNVVDRFSAIIGGEEVDWSRAEAAWLPARVVDPKPLLERMEQSAVDAMIEATKELHAGSEETTDYLRGETFKPEISFGDFDKIDLRVGVVVEAATVEGADKLIRVVVECGQRLTVFAGVRAAYPEPAVLVGRRVVVVANLAPRKMRFGTSEGMLLAVSGPDDEGLQLLAAPDDARGGWTVR